LQNLKNNCFNLDNNCHIMKTRSTNNTSIRKSEFCTPCCLFLKKCRFNVNSTKNKALMLNS
jgi:hypothetical protein